MNTYRKTGTPTKLLSMTHIWSFRSGDAMPDLPDNGKWMIFESADTVDRIWRVIKQATEQGKLGIAAKVSSKGLADRSRTKKYLICVYTENYHDKEEITRVKSVLQALGVDTLHSYKTSQKYATFRIDES